MQIDVHLVAVLKRMLLLMMMMRDESLWAEERLLILRKQGRKRVQKMRAVVKMDFLWVDGD
jgi:hypothetical protein